MQKQGGGHLEIFFSSTIVPEIYIDGLWYVQCSAESSMLKS
jgi:hypothetical protein